jgi:hypothetical protein
MTKRRRYRCCSEDMNIRIIGIGIFGGHPKKKELAITSLEVAGMCGSLTT